MKRSCFFPLLLSLLLFSCAKNQQPQVAERPKLPAIDPTDSTVGLGERILTDGAKLVDTSLPAASKNAFKISTDSVDVIKMQRGGSSTVTISTHPSDIESKDVLMGWDGEKKYLVLPITSIDSSSGKIKFNITLDSSIEPGLFEVSLALRDTGGRVSKHIRKWVVIGGKLTNVDSLIVGRWRCVQCSLGQDHSGHFCQLDSAKRFGEWWDVSYYKNNPWKALSIEESGVSTEPNLDGMYKIFNDSLPLYDESGTHGFSYHLVGINARKLIMRENDRERESFWVFARFKTNPE
jgi:hypothetical protein